jgi:dephospho-CoA kinase
VRTIGLTGGIGSGKSVVARLLADLGARVIDADRIGHDIYRPGSAGWSRVVEAFGEEIVARDGTIDRKKLGARVFADPQALRRLNAIVHPLMAGEIGARIAALRADGVRAPVVVEAAVLLEARWDELVDEVWLVVATPELVVARLTADRGLTAEEVKRRIGSQILDDERIARSDRVIRNTGSLDDLRLAVERTWREAGLASPD